MSRYSDDDIKFVSRRLKYISHLSEKTEDLISVASYAEYKSTDRVAAKQLRKHLSFLQERKGMMLRETEVLKHILRDHLKNTYVSTTPIGSGWW